MTTLLVVDDEPGLLDALVTILIDAGCQVEVVTSGQSALQALQASEANLPDLIIADIVMFEMTGLQLFEAVRSSPELSGIPFLFTSAFVSQEREELIAGLNMLPFYASRLRLRSCLMPSRQFVALSRVNRTGCRCR